MATLSLEVDTERLRTQAICCCGDAHGIGRVEKKYKSVGVLSPSNKLTTLVDTCSIINLKMS
jgi:hypothetical protein